MDMFSAANPMEELHRGHHNHDWASEYARMSDEELFRIDVWVHENQLAAHSAEVKRRNKAKEERRQAKEAEQARINQANTERLEKKKSTLAYSDDAAQEICERIACGELLINVCLDDHLPTMRRCTQWLQAHADFNALTHCWNSSTAR
jgi:hypothetical protein